MKVTFDHSETVADGIVTLSFTPERPLRYSAGQFVELSLPLESSQALYDYRQFTLSSSPTEDLLAITTKIPTPRSTFKQKLAHLQPGAKLSISEPMGDFVLPKDISIPLIFIAGGVGITPVRSIVKYLTDRDEQRSLQILYSASKPNQLAFLDIFRTAAATLHTFTRQSAAAWGGSAGSLQSSQILDTVRPHEDTLFYVSGPELFVSDIASSLRGLGIEKSRIITDGFIGYSIVR